MKRKNERRKRYVYDLLFGIAYILKRKKKWFFFQGEMVQ